MRLQKIVTFIAVGAISALTCASLPAAVENKFLSDRHISDCGLTCADCHDGKEKPTDKAGIKACLDCHGGYKGMAEQTKELEINPHDCHEGEIECIECHKPHAKPVDYCEQCHAFGLEVP